MTNVQILLTPMGEENIKRSCKGIGDSVRRMSHEVRLMSKICFFINSAVAIIIQINQ